MKSIKINFFTKPIILTIVGLAISAFLFFIFGMNAYTRVLIFLNFSLFFLLGNPFYYISHYRILKTFDCEVDGLVTNQIVTMITPHPNSLPRVGIINDFVLEVKYVFNE